MALAGDVAEVGERAGVGGGAASSDGSGATNGTASCGRTVSHAASGLPDVDLSVRLGLGVAPRRADRRRPQRRLEIDRLTDLIGTLTF